MSKISFWGPSNGMSGNTHTAIAISTLMAMSHKVTSLLMQANFNSRKIESSFTPYEDLVQSGAFQNSSIGINALIRLITSNKLTASSVQNYAKPVLKERLDVLYGISVNDKEAYENLITNLTYMTRKADEVYDLVFVDLPKTLDKKGIVDTVSDSDIVACVVNQDAVKLSEFFNTISTNEVLKDKTKIIIIADYEAYSKFNVMNIRLKYKVKDPIYTIPHNYIFSDACNSGMVVDYFYRNINADQKDYNGNFIFQTLNVVNEIVNIAKIKDN